MNPTGVTCVIPTLNSAHTLRQTLVSLQSQGIDQLSVIVVDSGSTDGTSAICRQFQVQMESFPAGNMYAAINYGLSLAETGWLTYLNSDDGLFANAYARLISRAEQRQAEIVYGNCDYVNGDGQFIYSFAAAFPDQLAALLRQRRMGFAQPTALFSRRVYHQLGGYDVAYRYKADADFFWRALLQQVKFTYLPGPSVAWFRLHARQLSQSRYDEIELEATRLFQQAIGQSQWSDRFVLARWQVRNFPHYILRVLRNSLLAQQLIWPRAQAPYEYPDQL